MPIGPPRYNEQEDGSIRPPALGTDVVSTYMTDFPLTCLASKTVQDVTALPTLNPHDGPITHSYTGSKPNSPVHP